MRGKKVYYFKLKFWPNRENREVPSDKRLLEDEENIYEMMKYRNGFRLYYLNWFEVWETYSYITSYYVPPSILITWIVTGNWIIGVSLFILWAWSKYFIIEKKRKSLWELGILVPWVFDRKIANIYGPQLPFREK